MMKSHRLRAPAALVAALALSIGPSPVVAQDNYAYAQYYDLSSHLGIDGYIRQSPTGPVPSAKHTMDYLNVCEGSSCAHWVQLGTYQGYLPNTNSPNAVHIFYENVDQCARYHQGDIGAPPQADYPYYLTYDGQGAHHQTCPNGSQSTFYDFELRKGSWASVPISYGQLGASSGPLIAATELDNGPPEANAYFGCTPTLTCSTASYGLHIYDGSFQLWNSGGNQLAYQPPYLNQKQHWWAFLTCASSC